MTKQLTATVVFASILIWAVEFGNINDIPYTENEITHESKAIDQICKETMCWSSAANTSISEIKNHKLTLPHIV
jgi:hypothetical protein